MWEQTINQYIYTIGVRCCNIQYDLYYKQIIGNYHPKRLPLDIIHSKSLHIKSVYKAG